MRFTFSMLTVAALMVLSASCLTAQTYPLNQTIPQAGTGMSSYTNTAQYNMGYGFTCNASGVSVVRLGSCANYSGAVAVTLWSVSTQQILATVTTASGAANTWRWGNLSSPVLLTNGAQYAVTMRTTNGYWYIYNSAPAVWHPTSGPIIHNGYRYSTGTATTFPNYTSTSGWHYGPADIGYVQGLTITTPGQLASGAVGSPYTATISADFGTPAYNWQVISGSLPPGMSGSVINNQYRITNTGTLSPGTTNFTLRVTDSLNATHQKAFSITVFTQSQALPFSDDFSTDKFWQKQGQWEWDVAQAYNPSGLPNRSEPGQDHTPAPSSDNKILGHNIGGDYANNMSPTEYAVSPPFDCSASGLQYVRLRFWSWSNFSPGDEAKIEITTNGGGVWTQVWAPATGTTFSQNTWTSMSVDISSYAVGFAVCQIRFAMGPTDSSIQNTGWCIDDLLIEEPDYDLKVQENGATGSHIQIYDNDPVGTARDFGQIGTSTQSPPLDLFITNLGPTPITLHPFTKTGAAPLDFYLNTSALINPLPVGQTTSFRITFYRQTVGVSTATISIGHNAAYSGTTPFDINVRGETAIPQPMLEVNVGSPTGTPVTYQQPAAGTQRDFGDQDINAGPKGPVTIFITNGGTGTLNMSAPAMGGTWHNQYSINSIGFSSQLTAGQSTSFEVSFDPSSIGQKDAEVLVSHSNGAVQTSPFSIPVTGNGTTSQQAGLTVHDGVVTDPTITHDQPASGQRNFGNQLVAAGPTPAITITIENTGGTNLTPGTPSKGGSDPGEFILDTTGFLNTVTPGSTTSFTVAFDPTTTGVKTATISFTHNDSGVTSPFIVNVRGNGVNTAPVMEVRETDQNGNLLPNPAPAAGILNFGTVDVNAGPSAPAVIYIENVGTANLTLGNASFQSPTTEFTLQAIGLAQTLAVGQSATFSITFDPTTPGTHTAMVEFVHNDGAAGTPFRLNVTGNATQNAPVIEVREQSTVGTLLTSGAPVVAGGHRDCGSIDVTAGNTLPKIISVRNTGNQNLVLGFPTVAGPNAADFIIGTANWNGTLTPGSDCSFEVSFDPTLGGMKDCHVQFTQNDPGQPDPFVVRFRGTAVDPTAVQITTPDLVAGTAGEDYGPFQMTAIQGNTPYTWSIYDGSLPLGMSMDTAGVIDGAPAGFGGSSQVTIRVEDTTGATHERQYTLVVTGDLSGGRAKAGGCAADNSGSGANFALALLGVLGLGVLAVRTRRRSA